MRQKNLGWFLLLIFALGFSLMAVGDDEGKLVGTWCNQCGKLIRAGQTCPHMRGGSSSSGSSGGVDPRAYQRYSNAYNAAVRLYRQAVHVPPQEAKAKYSQLLEYLEEALRNWPNEANVLGFMRQVQANLTCCDGQIAELNGDFDEARRLFNVAQEIYPKGSAIFQDNIAQSFDLEYSLALDQMKKKRWDEAERHLRAVAPRYDGATIYFKLGLVLAEQGKLADAEWAYRHAIDLEPSNLNAYGNLGNILHQQKRYAEAEEAFRQVIKLDPKNSDGHYNLGNVLREQERFAEAEAEYRQVIKLDPSSSNAYNNLGVALEYQKRFSEAESEYRQAILLDPANSKSYRNLGDVLREQKRYEAAEAAYRQALSIQPDNQVFKDLLDSLVTQRQEAKQEAKIVGIVHEDIAALIADISHKPASGQPQSQAAPKNQDGKKALDQAYTNREETFAGLKTGNDEIMRGGSALVFDNPVELKPAGSDPAVELKNVGKRPELPAWIKNDPKVKEAEEELAAAQLDLAELQAKRDGLDSQRTKLIIERHAAKDGAIFKAKDEELKQKEQDYNKELLEITRQVDKIDKLAKKKKLIEYEVESSGPPHAAGDQSSGPG
jgi:tetratricopeptide (TPR) repeat protein